MHCPISVLALHHPLTWVGVSQELVVVFCGKQKVLSALSPGSDRLRMRSHVLKALRD